jgi:hypothetical protein
MRRWLLKPPSELDIVRVLQTWRLWLIGAMVGAGIGVALYSIVPPPFRAQATVVVDHNLEQAYPKQPDREVFYYLARETLKLQEVAFSDAVVEMVSEQAKGVSVSDLRKNKLKLSQPSDGPWHFWAEDADPTKAQDLASIWAKAFVKYARQGAETERTLMAARKTLMDHGNNPALEAQIVSLERQSLGISGYVEVSLSEGQHLPVERSIGLGTFVFASSLLTIILLVFVLLFIGGEDNAR